MQMQNFANNRFFIFNPLDSFFNWLDDKGKQIKILLVNYHEMSDQFLSHFQSYIGAVKNSL